MLTVVPYRNGNPAISSGHFVFFLSNRMELMTITVFVRTLLRSIVDGCILPGTMNGTEICWLYFMQWKKETSAVAFALLSVLSPVEASPDSSVVTEQTVISEQ